MKVRNKKTGEIVECAIIPIVDGYVNEYEVFENGNSLTELNEVWEDYEEPFSTSFYTIVDGKIKHCIFYRERVAGCPDDAWAYLKDDGRKRVDQIKEVGLYFETKEEAEKAIEKLKAWKRLKDKGFKFQFWLSSNDGDTISFFIDWIDCETVLETENDLSLLFGGK